MDAFDKHYDRGVFLSGVWNRGGVRWLVLRRGEGITLIPNTLIGISIARGPGSSRGGISCAQDERAESMSPRHRSQCPLKGAS